MLLNEIYQSSRMFKIKCNISHVYRYSALNILLLVPEPAHRTTSSRNKQPTQAMPRTGPCHYAASVPGVQPDSNSSK